MDRFYRSRIVLAAVLLVLTGALGTAARHARGAVKMDPKADEVIQRVSDYFGRLKSFRVTVVNTMNIKGRGRTQQVVREYAVAMQRPNRLAVTQKTVVKGQRPGRIEGSVLSDGKRVYIYVSRSGEYMVRNAPATMDGILDKTDANAILGGVSLIGALLRTSPHDSILDGGLEGRYKGIETVGGVRCHHMKFLQKQVDWDVWVATGERPLVLKVAPDLTKVLASNRAGQPDKVDMTLRFDPWETDTNIPDKTFTFIAPAGARKVASLFEKRHPLLGKPAPGFKVNLLDGGQADLAQHKDKAVVILDFWATWCGPCVRALPIISEVAAAYRKKGVAFYAVNLRESPEAVRRFLKKYKITCAVAMDADGRVASLYGVTSIPQTVIVGRDGTVQAVHVGFNPDLKRMLQTQLDTLMAGKYLAPEE